MYQLVDKENRPTLDQLKPIKRIAVLRILQSLQDYSLVDLQWFNEEYQADREYWDNELEYLMGEQIHPRFIGEMEPPPKPPTHIYLMRCNRNNLIKIGRSRRPKTRENTLQSEDPSIEMIYHREADPKLERDIHKAFSKQRVRGEWFQLDEFQVSHSIFLIEELQPLSIAERRRFLRLPEEEQMRALAKHLPKFTDQQQQSH